MTDAERVAAWKLAERIAPTWGAWGCINGAGVIAGAIAGAALLALGAGLVALLGVFIDRDVMLRTFGTGMVVGAAVAAFVIARMRGSRPFIQPDLEGGEVEVVSYTARAALRARALEGASERAYFLDLGDGSVLFLKGRYLDVAEF